MDNWRIIQLREILEVTPDDEFVLFALAKEYMGLQDHEKALVYFDRLKKLNPAYLGMYYHLALVYWELNQVEQAFRCYDEGIALAKRLGDQHALSELQNARMNMEIDL